LFAGGTVLKVTSSIAGSIMGVIDGVEILTFDTFSFLVAKSACRYIARVGSTYLIVQKVAWLA
jgi:hypothetical protein